MDEFSRTKTKTSPGGGIGFVVAAALVVLLPLYALFAGGGVSTTVDPATLGAPEQSTPAAPAVPATDG
ncbi:hypothetical protein [Yoonia algicola]|uniref:Uncharacterized protein n=1 Tax=Yoonia algicola TaxID=3137368 RepID=A0AAN0M5E5_9RHOB